MPTITKDDLLYRDYHWTAYAHDDPRRTGEPDATLLNRHEGYEMLCFINGFCVPARAGTQAHRPPRPRRRRPSG